MNIATSAIAIQKIVRGHMCRLKRLPSIMYAIQQYLQKNNITFSTKNSDGRINSCDDEDAVIPLLEERFPRRIQKPNIRMWYDILAHDYVYGWIPINIKTTTTRTSDNTGNLAMCVYVYTDEKLKLDIETHYSNGKMSALLFEKLVHKQYNRTAKKDYYFVVLNKTCPDDIIINSVKGLVSITPNINNLPFQVRWDKNRNFHYAPIQEKIRLFLECLQKPRPSWSETFMQNIRTIKLDG